MTPKEKAIQLVEQFQTDVHSEILNNDAAKECAKLLAVEVLFQYQTVNSELMNWIYRSEKVVYWSHVINEIEHL